MGLLLIRSGAEQVADHLRGEIMSGRWKETIPGIHQLADELGVNHKTIKTALDLLEIDQLVIPQGPGRRRRIDRANRSASGHSLRICILTGDADAKKRDYILSLFHKLGEAGHHAFFAPGSLEELGMDLRRIIRLVGQVNADAWVISSGTRDILEWFAGQDFPAFALFGRRRGLSIPSIGPDHVSPRIETTRLLARLGHRRIVLLCRKGRRLPVPGAAEQAFLNELEVLGIAPSSYNLPNWEETPEGLQACLESLFRVTAPTALVMDEPPFLVAALQFLGRRNIRVPEDVSLIACDPDSSFDWCFPSIAHVHWDSRPWIRRVLRWATNVASGKKDLRQSLTKASLLEGGTVGPVSRKAMRAPASPARFGGVV
jgi:DNA-binding LacI/PurR family transcriptional regulator